jgi:hypothetical protein
VAVIIGLAGTDSWKIRIVKIKKIGDAFMLPQLYVLGDSISMQYGPDLERFTRGYFRYSRKGSELQGTEDLDQPLKVNGGDSQMVLDFMIDKDQEVFWKQDMIVLLNCGLHDIKIDRSTMQRQIELSAYKDNVLRACELLQNRGCQVVWVRTTPVDEEQHNRKYPKQFLRYTRDVLAFNRAADEVMAQLGIPAIDLYTFTCSLGEDIFSDHVHYKADIRALQAAFIAGHLLGIELRESTTVD